MVSGTDCSSAGRTEGREGGGEGDEKLSSARDNDISANIFLFFSYPITFANNLFGLFNLANNFLQYFSSARSRKRIVRPLYEQNNTPAFHKLLEIFQKSSRNFLKSCPKSARKSKIFFDLMVK